MKKRVFNFLIDLLSGFFMTFIGFLIGGSYKSIFQNWDGVSSLPSEVEALTSFHASNSTNANAVLVALLLIPLTFAIVEMFPFDEEKDES